MATQGKTAPPADDSSVDLQSSVLMETESKSEMIQTPSDLSVPKVTTSACYMCLFSPSYQYISSEGVAVGVVVHFRAVAVYFGEKYCNIFYFC